MSCARCTCARLDSDDSLSPFTVRERSQFLGVGAFCCFHAGGTCAVNLRMHRREKKTPCILSLFTQIIIAKTLEDALILNPDIFLPGMRQFRPKLRSATSKYGFQLQRSNFRRNRPEQKHMSTFKLSDVDCVPCFFSKPDRRKSLMERKRKKI